MLPHWTFGIDYESLPSLAKELIRDAERLSLLIKIPRGHLDKNSRSVRTKYQLSRTLSPLWICRSVAEEQSQCLWM